MDTATKASRARWSAAAACLVVITIAAPASAAPLEPPSDTDDESVALIDAAIEALEDGRSERYDELVQIARSGGVWLPHLTLDALENRDTALLLDIAGAIDADPTEVLDVAAVLVSWELEELQGVPLDGESTLEQAEAITDADEEGFAILQILDHRGIDVPASARLVLEPLDTDGGFAPFDDQYERAIADLDALVEAATPGASPGESPGADPSGTLNVDPVADPAATPESQPVATATSAITESAAPAPSQPSDTRPTEPAATPSPTSTAGSQWLVLATMALAIVAIVVGIGAALRGRRHDQLADFAFTDGLTGLKNRRRMDADVAEQQTRTRPTATLMIDVDHFKRFNDTHGHAMGDEVLRRVGSTLNGQFRRTDVPYRYGGEEFCVLLPDTTREEAFAAGERIRAAIAAIELPVDERVTASVGVSIGPASAIDATIERADRALYAAKENGRNQVAVA